MTLEISGDLAKALRALITYARQSTEDFAVEPWSGGPVRVSGDVEGVELALRGVAGVSVAWVGSA